MAKLVIRDLEETILQRLQEQAAAHGRTAEAEARVILGEALEPKDQDAWERVNSIRAQLAASGRTFSDSTDLLREDRNR
jgi:antitoxin FitA